MNDIFKRLRTIAIVLVATLFCASCSEVPSTSANPWQVLELPTPATFYDIAFTDTDTDRGWLVGSRGSLFETNDGGETWEERPLDFGEENIVFTSVDFSGDEGWAVGEPSILLHTTDAGKSWFRVPLSKKLPGAPSSIVATGANSAEMTTNIGAIYATEDGGQNWKALVQDALGVFRNIDRNASGQYVTVSANGNFYSTWDPTTGDWTPHNRQDSRRVQNMGFRPDGGLWMLARGGQLRFSDGGSTEEWLEAQSPEFSTSWGLLDMAYRTPEEVWVVGGSGNLLVSYDGGEPETWQKDRDVENVPSNFNYIRFLNEDRGFILGQRGILLRYTPEGEAA
ncbi:MAG: photosynthesis system II assembly factor Ycf48 [Geitlerinemataceae cyanobacterium]